MRKKNCLKNLLNRQGRIVVGLNSGTSADGIDAAIIRINSSGLTSRVEFIDGATYKFEPATKNKILNYAEADFKDGEKWLKLDAELAEQFASACKRIVKKAGLRLDMIDLIGSHGQTIRHLPKSKYGSLTYQIADPSRIAVNTGITVVGDFRIADIAASGEGAPLTPIVNAILFGNRRKRIGVLNIGGVANITLIRYEKRRISLFGCDTGPGDMLIDYLSRKLYKLPYDKGGRLALRGKIDKAIISDILKSKYYSIKGPKSTGREQYGKRMAESFIGKCRSRKLKAADMISTASYLTVKAAERCIAINNLQIDELILTGGGAKNKFLSENLRKLIPYANIKLAADYGYPGDYLEAISFAILANEAICSNRYDLRNVTGSKKAVVLGKICQA